MSKPAERRIRKKLRCAESTSACLLEMRYAEPEAKLAFGSSASRERIVYSCVDQFLDLCVVDVRTR